MKDSCIFYRDWFDALGKYSPEMRLELYDSIVDFGLNGETTKPLSSVATMVFEAFKPKLVRDYCRYGLMCEKNKQNGSKGGRPKQETEKNQWIIEKPKKPSGLSEEIKNPKNHDNDNEYDNDNDNEKEIIIEDKSSLSQSDEIESIKNFFNESVKGQTIPKITCIKGQRLHAVKARLREYGLDNIFQAITNAAQSDFLNGRNNNAFTATFDWIFRPNNFTKVLEGNYNDRKHSAGNIGNKAYEVGVSLQERIFARMEQEETGAD